MRTEIVGGQGSAGLNRNRAREVIREIFSLEPGETLTIEHYGSGQSVTIRLVAEPARAQAPEQNSAAGVNDRAEAIASRFHPRVMEMA